MFELTTLRFLSLTMLLAPAAAAQTAQAKPADKKSNEGRLAANQSQVDVQKTGTKKDTLFVTATRSPQNAFDSARAIESLDERSIRLWNQSRALPDALFFSPGVSVQKTGSAQGSPKIRGQNGRHTLLLVDGIRINNSTWRAGNVEYWNTVDAWSLERLEIVRGPSSVLYGSDAVSGTAQAFSLGPSRWSREDRSLPTQRLLTRFGSAEQSFVVRAEGGLPLADLGFHYGITYKDFGDIIAGQELGRLPYSSYTEFDVDLKYVMKAFGGDLSIAYQHTNPKGGRRTHSTVFSKSWRGTTAGSDFDRRIDQQRDLVYAQWMRELDSGVADDLWLSLSYQRFDEDEDRTRSNSRRRMQGVTDNQVGILARLTKDFGGWQLTYGTDIYLEFVDSYFREYNADGSLRVQRPRGPVADDSTYNQFGLYADGAIPLSQQWDLGVGARYNYIAADAKKVDPTGTGSIGPIRENWSALIGQARLTFKPSQTWRVFTGLSQSFRAPNLSDLTRFDVALSGDQEIPSPGLDPEKYLTFELGTRFDDGLYGFELNTYYTEGKDLIRRQPTGTILPGGIVEVTKANVGSAYWTGFEIQGHANLGFLDGLDQWEVFGFADYVRALEDRADPNDDPRIRPKGLPPASGMLGFRWMHPSGDYRFEVFARIVGGIDKSDYNEAEKRNTQRIPPTGLPGYTIYGMRGTVRISEPLTAALSIENIANKDFRIFDSGQNEPGTNVILTLQANF